MSEFRTAIENGDAGPRPGRVIRKEGCRRQEVEPTLVDVPIPRVERRRADQRHENRFRGVVDRATIVFRRKRQLVRIVNVSGSGVMIESNITPHIGEVMRLEFENFEPLQAVVRWVKKGRIGLDVGQDAIELA